MRTITVGFSKPTKWKPFSWLIMVGYGIPYDHVYIKLRLNSYERDVIYQASSVMVNFMASDVFNSFNVVVDEFQVDITDENYKALMQFAVDNSGKSYGYTVALGMGIVRLFGIFGKKIKNPFAYDGETYVCSELAGYILEQYAGANIPTDVSDITPKDVYNYLISLKH